MTATRQMNLPVRVKASRPKAKLLPSIFLAGLLWEGVVHTQSVCLPTSDSLRSFTGLLAKQDSLVESRSSQVETKILRHRKSRGSLSYFMGLLLTQVRTCGKGTSQDPCPSATDEAARLERNRDPKVGGLSALFTRDGVVRSVTLQE